MKLLRRFGGLLALLSILPLTILLSGGTFVPEPESFAVYLYYINGVPDSTTHVFAVPADSTFADTTRCGGMAYNPSPGIFIWKPGIVSGENKVTSELVDIWYDPDPYGSPAVSQVHQGVMFGRQTVVDSSITSAKFDTFVQVESLYVASYLDAAVTYTVTLEDTTNFNVDTLTVLDQFQVPDTVVVQFYGAVDVDSTLDVEGFMRLAASGQAIILSGNTYVDVTLSLQEDVVPATTLGEGPFCIVTSQRFAGSTTGLYAHGLTAYILSTNTLRIERVRFLSAGDWAEADTVNYVLLMPSP